MINVSNEFKKAMLQRQDFKENAEITLTDGTVLNLKEKDFSILNNSVTDAADANAVPIGAAICRSVQIELLNDDNHLEKYDFYGAKIRLYLTFELSNTTEKIELGSFTVTSPESYGITVVVNAFDNMYRANAAYNTDLAFPASAAAVLRDTCSRCGILLASTSFLHDDFIVQNRPSGEYTFRQVIGYIAMIACGNARINRNGKLEILTYNLDFNSEHHDLTEWKSLTVDTSDIVITGVKTTRKVKKTEGEEEKEVEEAVNIGAEGYMLTVNNPLVSGNEETLVSWIFERLSGIPFRKFTGDYITYPLAEFMDLAVLTDWKGNIYNTFLTDVNFVFFGITTMKNSAESGLRNAAKYSNENVGTNVHLQELIEQERSDRKQAVENLSEALKAGSGMYATYERQPDGSTITYLHDKPSLKESRNVIKIASEAIGISNDGGKTYPYGFVLDGDLITRILYAHGISADYIDSGAITVRDSNGNIIFSVDMDTKKVIISGDSVQIGGRPVQDVINSGISESKNYSDKQLADYANTVTKDLENLQAQVDGQVEDWYFDYEPSMQNIPASQWTTTEERQKHIGDRFFWKSKGYAYRFMENGGVWGWTLLQDTDITKAMQTAQNAKDIADGKRRTFITTPVPPYDIGDLWTNGKDILTCIVSRASGAAYVSSDWEKQNHYTDDTVANQALEEARKAHNLTISLDNDYQGIPADYNGNIADFPTVKTHVTVFYGHDDVSASCTYSVQKSSSVAGTWDNTRREYTVTGLSDDTGWVDITANYMQLFTVTKRFNVAKNKDGAPGANGTSVTIKSKSVTYQVGTSGTVKPTGVWSETIPQVPAGQYLWTKTYVEYSNGEHTESYSVSYKAKDGENGTDGADGKPGANGHDGTSVTITSKSITYQASASGTTPPTGEWKTSVPSVTKGQYLWTRTVVNYSDGTSTTSYSVGYQGTNGTNGTNGRNTATVYLYQRKSSAPSNPTNPLVYTFATGAISGTINNGWSAKIPSGTDPLYVIVATASSNTASYSIPASAWSSPVVLAQNGADGKPGVDGTNGKPGSNGTNGLNAATIYLYQRKTSVPAKPSAEITYTFATGTVSGLTNGWSKTIPSGTAPLYVILATAASTAASDTIAATEWSTPVVMAENGKPGADGSPGRTYFMELSSLVVKQSKDNTISPNYITMSAFYRDGTNTARTPYAGRFKIEESTDGNTWKTVYTSSENESSVRHSLYSVLSTQSGGAITTASGRSIGIPRDVVALRCTLYAAGGTTQMLDIQSAAVVLDVDALTHEEIFNLLTKNGEIKGIYQEGNQLYISFTYAKGGALTLGGSGNGNGTLKILNTSGAQVGYIDNTGGHFNQGEFAGALKAATGNFSGNLNASVGGTIGGWKINVSNQTLTSPDGNIVLDAKNAKIITSGKNVNGSVKTVISNIQSTFPSVDVINGTVNVKRSTGGYSFQVDSSSSSQIGFFNPFGDGGSSSPTDRIKVNGNFSATGTKNREVKTQDYDNRLQYCYEMASPMFGDIGEAVTDDSGKCYIYLDDIFLETVNTDIEYQVFLQKEAAGDLWVDQKSREYFVVNGTPELNFAWEIKVKQKDFEFERLNESVELDDEIDRIPYLRQGQTLFEEYSQEQEEGQLLFEAYCQEQEAVQ